jgi:hypothetical protein
VDLQEKISLHRKTALWNFRLLDLMLILVPEGVKIIELVDLV